MEAVSVGQELRRLRQWREWTLSQVAHRVGISKALLALVEQGKRRLPLDAFRRLAQLYETSLALLMSPHCRPSRSASGGQSWQGVNLLASVTDAALRGCTLRLLRPVEDVNQAEWLELCLRPGTQLPATGYWDFPAPTHGIAVEGNLLIEMPGDELLVRCGESFCIQAQQPHRYRNYLTSPIRALLVLERAVL